MSPILNAQTLEIFSRSADQTRRVGMRLGTLLTPGDVINLVGDLGSGKTTLVQGIAAGWGSLDPVSSPTFVLVNSYRRPDHSRFFHLDAYRLQGAEEAQDLDIDTLIEIGPLVVEWADLIEKALPSKGLWVSLRTTDVEQRVMQFSSRGEYYEEMLAELKKGIYGI
jgi:tRNA threonylcarbamoyladenosine biosynthesis protein TsaE